MRLQSALVLFKQQFTNERNSCGSVVSHEFVFDLKHTDHFECCFVYKN